VQIILTIYRSGSEFMKPGAQVPAGKPEKKLREHPIFWKN
jgi:hypothetical protein